MGSQSESRLRLVYLVVVGFAVFGPLSVVAGVAPEVVGPVGQVVIGYEDPGFDFVAVADLDVVVPAVQVSVLPAFVETAGPGGHWNSGISSFFPLFPGFSG